MKIPKKSHKQIGRWVLGCVLLLALNIGIWFALHSAPTPTSTSASPGFWSASILIVIGLLVVDLVCLAVLVIWLAKIKAGMPIEEPVVHPPSEHPVDDPSVEQKKEED